MKRIKYFLGLNGKRPCRTQSSAASYARRGFFEQLEDRTLLAASFTLNGLQTPIRSGNVEGRKRGHSTFLDMVPAAR
jgi:hypothetical protein